MIKLTQLNMLAGYGLLKLLPAFKKMMFTPSRSVIFFHLTLRVSWSDEPENMLTESFASFE